MGGSELMSTPRRPNILIVITDQQQHALMSCAGTPWVQTPHLDRLAAGGMRFTRAYCSDPVCVPSRFSMFTGRMPSAIGLRGNEAAHPDLYRFTAQHDATALGHCLLRAGYRTWYGGKVHLPIELSAERVGFTTYTLDERERLAIDAADLIHCQDAQPWAMVVSLINPHDICYRVLSYFADRTASVHERENFERRRALPLLNVSEALTPPAGVSQEDFLRNYLPPLPANLEPQSDEPELLGTYMSLSPKPHRVAIRAGYGEREWRLHRWAYARLMERVDRQIGVVLDALTASGQDENTLVIMTSDHGDHGGSHRLEQKTFFYEEAARVPWIMRLPGRIPAGQIEESCLVATGLDLMATCCDYAEAELPSHSRGISLRGTAERRPQARMRSAVYGENAVSRMIAEQRWKYVRYDRGANAEQLYDLAQDPGEIRNHAQQSTNAAVLERLRRDLDQHMAEHAKLALGPLPTKMQIE